MIGIVHLLTGAAIGALIPDITTAFILAFFSHYLLDWLPHIDPETFARKKLPYTWGQFLALALDVIAVGLVTLLFYAMNENWLPILVAAAAAQLPDWMIPFEKYKFFEPLKRMHSIFHWDSKLAKSWKWYLSGILTQTAISLAFLLTILWL